MLSITLYDGILMVDEVKKEATGKRPSILSKWYRRTLGTDYAIADIDFLITRISNKDAKTRYMIIEEKNVSSFDRLSVGLGEARSLNELATDIIKENIPIFIVYIKANDLNISEGAYVYRFNSHDIKNKQLWFQYGPSWYVDLTNKCQKFTSSELATLINAITTKKSS